MLYDDLINTNSVFSLRFPSIAVLALAIQLPSRGPAGLGGAGETSGFACLPVGRK